MKYLLNDYISAKKGNGAIVSIIRVIDSIPLFFGSMIDDGFKVVTQGERIISNGFNTVRNLNTG